MRSSYEHLAFPASCFDLQLWLTRIMLLVKIRQISLAENELAAFGNLDSPDLYFEFYSEAYPGRKGELQRG